MTVLRTSPDAVILRFLNDRSQATAAAIGEACCMTPGEVRGRLAGLESQRLITGRQDTRLVPPARTFVITGEGRRRPTKGRTVMPTDVQRIELAFPAEAMLHVVTYGADPKDPTVQRVRRLFLGTVDEAFAGLTGRDLRKLRTRLDRTMRGFLAPIVMVGGRVDVVGVIAWRILAAVLDADVLVLPEGTPLSDALEEMRPALERAAADPVVHAWVATEWAVALRRLQVAGLYGAVAVRIERAACA